MVSQNQRSFLKKELNGFFCDDVHWIVCAAARRPISQPRLDHTVACRCTAQYCVLRNKVSRTALLGVQRLLGQASCHRRRLPAVLPPAAAAVTSRRLGRCIRTRHTVTRRRNAHAQPIHTSTLYTAACISAGHTPPRKSACLSAGTMRVEGPHTGRGAPPHTRTGSTLTHCLSARMYN